MKTIQPLSTVLAVILTIFMISSCGSAEEKLPGNWVTETVSASIDSTKASAATLASIDKAVASAKTTIFTLKEDHSMELSIDGYTSKAFWSFDEDEKLITFLFDQKNVGEPIELGKLEGKKITYTSKVKNGTITAVYMKE